MPAVTEAAQDIFEVPLPDSEQIAFTPTKTGLPVFHGKSFEDHVEAWKYINESVECRLWALGAIAASLVKKYGDSDVKRFAYEVRLSRSRVYEIADTYRKFEKSERSEILSFHHHTIAAKADNPEAAIDLAESKEWSTRQLDHYVETGMEPPEKSPKPSRPLQSMTRRALAKHIEDDALPILLELKTKCPSAQFASKYYSGWVQELIEAKDEILREDASEALISAWKHGNHTTSDLARATGLDVNFVNCVMREQQDDGVFERVDQGGKTEVARGDRTILWHLVGEPLGSDFTAKRANVYENGDD